MTPHLFSLSSFAANYKLHLVHSLKLKFGSGGLRNAGLSQSLTRFNLENNKQNVNVAAMKPFHNHESRELPSDFWKLYIEYDSSALNSKQLNL